MVPPLKLIGATPATASVVPVSLASSVAELIVSVAPVMLSVSALATGAAVPTGGGGGGGGGGAGQLGGGGGGGGAAQLVVVSGATREGHGEIWPVGAPPL